MHHSTVSVARAEGCPSHATLWDTVSMKTGSKDWREPTPIDLAHSAAQTASLPEARTSSRGRGTVPRIGGRSSAFARVDEGDVKHGGLEGGKGSRPETVALSARGVEVRDISLTVWWHIGDHSHQFGAWRSYDRRRKGQAMLSAEDKQGDVSTRHPPARPVQSSLRQKIDAAPGGSVECLLILRSNESDTADARARGASASRLPRRP
ncbi:hypothetical protein K488DRAFT_75069 [Vararia minispora EC-137]|uniref:Uncharacterized protein n=1 Tax=Vararia minispora EC-137 TaxID=1314806 RepID=A0ACB8Q4Z8_9AGAM|nr:hypothetical protein K488DRAFT_75069 [Vararia minispora EC-137]